MKTRTQIILAIVGAAGIAAAVAAYGHGFRHGNPQEHMARHLERISQELKLDEHQAAKLNTVAATLRRQHEAMRPAHEQTRQAVLALLESPVLDRPRALGLVHESTQHINERAPDVIAAFADFYDTLTPTQQQSLRAHIAARMDYAGHHRRQY